MINKHACIVLLDYIKTVLREWSSQQARMDCINLSICEMIE